MNPVLQHVRSIGLPAYGDDEVVFVADVMKRHRPTHVFEWGTNVGASARLFYECARILGFPCEVHTTELPIELAHLDRDHPGHRYGQWIKELPIHTYRGDGLMESLRLNDYLLPERPLFFLDGSHEHMTVLGELTWVSWAAPKAVLLVHDTVNLTGMAISDFVARSPGYERKDCLSDSGIAALWPRSA